MQDGWRYCCSEEWAKRTKVCRQLSVNICLMWMMCTSKKATQAGYRQGRMDNVYHTGDHHSHAVSSKSSLHQSKKQHKPEHRCDSST